ncbi:MarR family winged helix-turn-helix transcriptional regulator [Angustibacter aerolatus]
MQRPADVDHVDEADVLRIQSELGLLFRRARSHARRAAEEIHPGLTQPAYVVLARVVEHGSTRASELVELFGIDKAAVSRQVTTLEQLGLVERTDDPADRRAQVIAATAEGRRRYRRSSDRAQRVLREQLGQWSPQDARDLGRLLGRFNEAFGRTTDR